MTFDSKFNIILHITTSCNYNCSYCDVVKTNKFLSNQLKQDIVDFIKRNSFLIEKFKFFGGEPLLAWKDIKQIVDETFSYLGENFEIVTNTSLLTDEIASYFSKCFKIVFFSIDSENFFDFEKVERFAKKYNLQNKLYFNLVISPGREKVALEQFFKLYNIGFKGFNILPVYFTKPWSASNLKNLSAIMKKILDLSVVDKSLKLYGFQENLGQQLKLANQSIFIDIDGKVYFSDIVSTYLGQHLKDKLFLGEVKSLSLQNLENKDFSSQRQAIEEFENLIYQKVQGQKQLKEIMDYFSTYLNKVKN